MNTHQSLLCFASEKKMDRFLLPAAHFFFVLVRTSLENEAIREPPTTSASLSIELEDCVPMKRGIASPLLAWQVNEACSSFNLRFHISNKTSLLPPKLGETEEKK